MDTKPPQRCRGGPLGIWHLGGQTPAHSSGPQAPSPQCQAPRLFFFLAGTLHSITFFSLSTLIISMIIAFVSTLLGKLQGVSDYEVSYPSFPPFVLAGPWDTALGFLLTCVPTATKMKGSCLSDDGGVQAQGARVRALVWPRPRPPRTVGRFKRQLSSPPALPPNSPPTIRACPATELWAPVQGWRLVRERMG